MKRPHITRRALLKGGLIIGASSVILQSIASNESTVIASTTNEDEISTFGGLFNRVGANLTQLIKGHTDVSSEGPEIIAEIRFTENTIFSRGYSGIVSGINEFVTGDEVAAEGIWEEDVFLANNIASIYHLAEGEVSLVRGNYIEIFDHHKPGSPKKSFYTIPNTVVINNPGYIPKPLSDIVPGDNLLSNLWRDPISGNLLAVRIGIHQE